LPKSRRVKKQKGTVCVRMTGGRFIDTSLGLLDDGGTLAWLSVLSEWVGRSWSAFVTLNP
jgi:hypothetical protein